MITAIVACAVHGADLHAPLLVPSARRMGMVSAWPLRSTASPHHRQHRWLGDDRDGAVVDGSRGFAADAGGRAGLGLRLFADQLGQYLSIGYLATAIMVAGLGVLLTTRPREEARAQA
jgi:hypothetical protein